MEYLVLAPLGVFVALAIASFPVLFLERLVYGKGDNT